MFHNYPFLYFQNILQYFFRNYDYLGTGDNDDIVFATTNSSQYIIVCNNYNTITIHGNSIILKQLKQYLLEIYLAQ